MNSASKGAGNYKSQYNCIFLFVTGFKINCRKQIYIYVITLLGLQHKNVVYFTITSPKKKMTSAGNSNPIRNEENQKENIYITNSINIYCSVFYSQLL